MNIVSHGPLKVVGISITAEWEALWTEMPKAWQSFIERSATIQHRVSPHFIDVSWERQHGRYTQLIAAEVSSLDVIPEGMRGLEIPQQTYLFYRHEGPLSSIAASFGRMYEWAEQNAVAVDEFKLDVGYTPQGTESVHDLFIRVVSEP